MNSNQSTRARVPSAARSHHARAAVLTRFHPERVDEIAELKRQASVITLEDHIRRVVAAAPPLTLEQRDRLAALLRPATAHDVSFGGDAE